MMQRAIRFFQQQNTFSLHIWGPISLLCTVAIAAKTAIPFDLLFIALTGLYLSARWQLRGCYWALALLGIAAAVKHTFLITDHLWQLGLEGSLVCAFFITALAFEQGTNLIASLTQQMETRKAALSHLEEELAKVQEATQSQQIAAQEKITLLQKELEELQTEHSSILILNEVLRKTTARHAQESETHAAAALDQERQVALLKAELAEQQADLSRLSQTEPLAIQNSELMKELNAARYEKEQTHLINETLARLYARESLKAKEADQEAGDLESQLAAARKEVQNIAEPLKQQLATAHNEIETLTFQFEKAVTEANQGHLALQKLNEVQTERNFLRERLEAAMEEISLIQQQKPQTEPLLKQLKKQFEEKNQILHQTRADLFKADTELQKLRMERATLELSPVPKEVESELQGLGEQVAFLEEENLQLQDLVTLLSEKMQPSVEKKK